MALEFTFEISTPHVATDVADVVASAGQAMGLFHQQTGPSQVLEGATASTGTWIRVREQNTEPWQTIPEVLGIVPTVAVRFRLDKEADITRQQAAIVGLTLDVMGRIAGDAVLHREMETAWLVRKDGSITLNDRDDIWPPERLASVPQPYRRAAIDLDDD